MINTQYILSKRYTYETTLWMITCVLIFLVYIFSANYSIHIVDGNSMMPTLKNGSLTVVKKQISKPNHGDIITFNNGGESYVKRVVATAGEVVNIDYSARQLTVNGEKLNAYTPFDEWVDDMSYPFEIPENSIFVLGDNEANSLDSRTIGSVNTNLVTGKVLFAKEKHATAYTTSVGTVG